MACSDGTPGADDAYDAEGDVLGVARNALLLPSAFGTDLIAAVDGSGNSSMQRCNSFTSNCLVPSTKLLRVFVSGFPADVTCGPAQVSAQLTQANATMDGTGFGYSVGSLTSNNITVEPALFDTKENMEAFAQVSCAHAVTVESFAVSSRIITVSKCDQIVLGIDYRRLAFAGVCNPTWKDIFRGTLMHGLLLASGLGGSTIGTETDPTDDINGLFNASGPITATERCRAQQYDPDFVGPPSVDATCGIQP